jgi:hypothetical protein
LVSLYFGQSGTDEGLRKLLIKQFAELDLDNPKIETFEQLIANVCAVPDELSNPHYRSQSYLWIADLRPPLHFVGRFESLLRDWEHLSNLFELKPLKHHNRSEHKPYQSYYDDRLRRMVEERYKEDLFLFGYTFD